MTKRINKIKFVIILLVIILACNAAFFGCGKVVVSEQTAPIIYTKQEAFDIMRPNMVEIKSIESGSGGENYKYGTGTIITLEDSRPIILTNYHVINNSSYSMIKYADSLGYSELVTATVLGYDEYNDIAIIKADVPYQNIYVRDLIANQSTAFADVAVGDTTYSIGNAGGTGIAANEGECVSRSTMVSVNKVGDATRKKLVPSIQVSSEVVGGMSGGSVVNGSAQIVGVGTYRNEDYTSRSYMVPSSVALSIYKAVIENDFKKGKEVNLLNDYSDDYDYGLYLSTAYSGATLVNFLADCDQDYQLSPLGFRAKIQQRMNGCTISTVMSVMAKGEDCPLEVGDSIVSINGEAITYNYCDMFAMAYKYGVTDEPNSSSSMKFTLANSKEVLFCNDSQSVELKLY